MPMDDIIRGTQESSKMMKIDRELEQMLKKAEKTGKVYRRRDKYGQKRP